MIRVKTPALILTVMLAGCAAEQIPETSSLSQLPGISYEAPATTPAPARIWRVDGTLPEAVNNVIRTLNGLPFNITHIDRQKGIITARFKADPDDYLDCGLLTLVSSAGETRTVPAASRDLLYEVPINNNTRIGSVSRKLHLDGRLLVEISETASGQSDIKISGDYVLTRRAALFGNAAQTLADETQYLAFGSGQAVGFGGGRSTICQSNGELEQRALLGGNLGVASSIALAQPGDSAEPVAPGTPPRLTEVDRDGRQTLSATDEQQFAAAVSPDPDSFTEARGSLFAAAPTSVERVRSEFETLDCAPLTAIEDGDVIRVTGFVGSQASLDQLKASIRTLENVGDVTFQVVVTSSSFCDMLEVSLPLHERNSIEGAGASIGVDGSAVVLQEGDRVVLRANAPNFDNYVYIIYMQEDGKLLNLVPSLGQTDNARLANEEFSIGDKPDEPSFTVSPPYGDDLVMLVASSEPLFLTPRPLVEQGSSFAGELQRRVDDVLSRGGKVVADLVFLRTSPKPS